MRTRFRIVAAAGVGLAVAVGISGCGAAQQLSAKDKVTKAFAEFDHAKAASFTVSLGTSVADLRAIASARGEQLPAGDAKVIDQVIAGDLAFTVEAPEGKTLGDSAAATGQQDPAKLLNDPAALAKLLKQQGSFAAEVRLGGGSVLDLRSVQGTLYARADAPKILAAAGESADHLDQALADLPPELAPLAKAARGKWVSIDLAQLAAKAQGRYKALPSTPVPSASVDPAKLRNLLDSLKLAYDKNATITNLGDSDRGEGFRIGAPVRQIATAVQDDLIALVGSGASSDVKRVIRQLPNKTFTLDVWVKDGALTGVSLDLTQFLGRSAAGKKLAIDVAVDTSPAKVEVPSGATALNPGALLDQLPSASDLTRLSGGLGGSGGFDSGGAQGGLSDQELQDLLGQLDPSGSA